MAGKLAAALCALALLGYACDDGGDDSSAPAGTESQGDETPSELGALIEDAPSGAAFYDPPDPIPGEPGDIIWAREERALDNGRMYVVLYRSENLMGEPIATSGWIAVPDGPAPEGGRPILSWGHGTVGVADECAPTIQESPVGASMPLLDDLLERGIVVAASDYEGLGTPGLHPYVISESEANALLDAARAAQRLTPAEAGDEVLFAGHSQGGHAIAAANEYASSYAPELDVLGAISISGGVVGEDPELVEFLVDSPFRGFIVLSVGAQTAAYGEELAPPERLLRERGIEELPALEEGCVEEILTHFQDIPTEELFKPDLDFTLTDGTEPDDLNRPGQRPGAGPVLVVHGTADSIIAAESIVPYVEDVCSRDEDIFLSWYEGGSHSAIYDRSTGMATEVLDWIDARLRGEDPPTVCGEIPPLPA